MADSSKSTPVDTSEHVVGTSDDDQISGGYVDAQGNAVKGDDGVDFINGNAGSDSISTGDGNDFILGRGGDDVLSGGAGNDKLVGGSGSDVIEGGAGNDHMWGGEWSADGSSDTFIVSGGSGKDMIYDFEADHDVVDLSAYGLEFSDLSALMLDKGWATEIDLSGLDGGQAGDKLILKSIVPDELDESNFIL